MSDLQARFEQAQIDLKSLSERPDNAVLLELYALYKQATGSGDGALSGSGQRTAGSLIFQRMFLRHAPCGMGGRSS